MRGFAAILVMIFHARYGFVNVSSINMQLFEIPFFANGYLWVDFFFMLSGYLLAHRYGDENFQTPKSIFKFAATRLARIYPLHFFSLAAFVFYLGWLNGPSFLTSNLSSIIANLFLVHGWFGMYAENWNYPSWSLSAEWAAYLLFPALCLGYRHLRGKFALSLIALAVLLMLFGIYVTNVHDGSLDITYGLGWRRCLFSFSIGIVTYSLSGCLRKNRPEYFYDFLALSSFGLLLLQLKIAPQFATKFKFPEFFFIYMGVLVLLFLGLARGKFAKVLQLKPFVYLGEISFSVYMWHAFVIRAFRDWFDHLGRPSWSVASSVFAFGAVLLVTILISAFSYRLIEQKLYLFLRKKVESIQS